MREDVEPVRADYAPEGTDERTGLWPTLKRTALEFQEDNMTDWAAALTYYGLLSLFPALIALVSILGLFGDPPRPPRRSPTSSPRSGPSSAAETFAGPIESITSNRSTAGILLVVGLATALWAASGYIGAFIRASNVIWETPEGRGFFKLRPLQLAVTLVLIILFALVALSLVLTGPVVEAVGDSIGVGSTATDDLGHRQVAGAARGRDPDDLDPLLRRAEREAPRLPLDHGRQPGRGLRLAGGLSGRSPSTSPTSAPTTRPTAPSAGSSPCWSGSGSRTWRCCSGWS